MAYVHDSVNQISIKYQSNEKHYNYTTPKTFLEFIFLYKKLLLEKNTQYIERIQRLEGGMFKLAECERQVSQLKVLNKSIYYFVKISKIFLLCFCRINLQYKKCS